MDLERVRLVVKWLIGSGYANNQKEVGELLGYTNESSFSQILNGKKTLPIKFIDKLLSIDGNLSKDWLLSGKGEMIKDRNNSEKLSINNEVQEPMVDYGKKNEDHIYEAINNLSASSNRDSISISELIETTKKMADTAERNSRTLEKLVDMLQNSGFNISDSLEFQKGGTYPNVKSKAKLANEETPANKE